MNIRVNRLELIKVLEATLKIRKENKKKRDAAHDKWRAETKKYEDNLVKLAKAGKLEVDDVTVWHDRLTLKFKVPSHMETPEFKWQDFGISSDIDEIQSTINLLKLSTDDTISAAAYKQVASWV